MTDPHLAAYAKGLEDAAAECDEVASENHWAFAPERHEFVEVAAARIRALSPLDPGARIVVVPAEGSPELEALVKLMAVEIGVEINRDELPDGGWAEFKRDLARGALRALKPSAPPSRPPTREGRRMALRNPAYRIKQDGMIVARVECVDSDTAWREIHHYITQYRQDGPLQVQYRDQRTGRWRVHDNYGLRSPR